MAITVDQFIQDLDRKVALIESGKPLEIAARSAHADAVGRIFEGGQKTNGSKIGTYDDQNELWVADDKLPKKGSHKGKTGKTIKTTFYSSYKQLRAQQDREAGFVNLRLLNDLQSDYANASITRGSNQLAEAKPIKVNKNLVIIALKRELNVRKKEGLEKKYGRIFELNQAEIDKFNRVYNFEVSRILLK